MDIYTLLDDASTLTLIDRAVAECIGGQGPRGTIRVNCVGGLTEKTEVNYVSISIKGKFSDETIILYDVRSIPSLGIASQIVRASDMAPTFTGTCYRVVL